MALCSRKAQQKYGYNKVTLTKCVASTMAFCYKLKRKTDKKNTSFLRFAVCNIPAKTEND